MFGLSYLFYPWGFIVQGPGDRALSRGAGRRTIGSTLFSSAASWGQAFYIVAEVLPDLRLLRGVLFQGVWAAVTHTKGRNRYSGQSLGGKITKNWGELYKDQGQYEKAAARRVQSCDHRGEAIRSTRSIRGRNRRWDWMTWLRRFRI